MSIIGQLYYLPFLLIRPDFRMPKLQFLTPQFVTKSLQTKFNGLIFASGFMFIMRRTAWIEGLYQYLLIAKKTLILQYYSSRLIS